MMMWVVMLQALVTTYICRNCSGDHNVLQGAVIDFASYVLAQYQLHGNVLYHDIKDILTLKMSSHACTTKKASKPF